MNSKPKKSKKEKDITKTLIIDNKSIENLTSIELETEKLKDEDLEFLESDLIKSQLKSNRKLGI